MRYAGIDPGKNGALVVVGDDGVTVLDVQRWSRAETPPPLPILTGDTVAVEAQYVGPGAHASLKLAEWTGILLAGLPTGCHVLRPLAAEWRAKVFRASRLRRAPAKARAIEACTKHARCLDPKLRRVSDVAEAWCMARFAWGFMVYGPAGSAP